MVNTTIVSRFSGNLPLGRNRSRKIAGGPLYPAEEVLELLRVAGGQGVHAWTAKSISDTAELELDAEDLFKLVQMAIKDGRFLGSQWCVQGRDGPWAACDAYSLVRSEWIPAAGKDMDIGYYIKFAIARTGKALLMVSCHLQGN